MAFSFVIEPKFWREIAGVYVQFPTVNSRIYYFPEGHCEEASSSLSNLCPITKHCIPCTVESVQYFVDSMTDEIFTKLTLKPVPSHPPYVCSPFPCPRNLDDPISFPRTINHSDDLSSGEFRVPKQLAEAMFPPLVVKDYIIDPQLPYRAYGQRLQISDLSGTTWDFHHVYRIEDGTHWVIFERDSELGCTFSLGKKLVSGDTLLFIMIPKTRKLYIALRRVHKTKVSPEAVKEAIELAMDNKPFEVVYYPNRWVGWMDFVVRADIIQQRLLAAKWEVGMRVCFYLEMAGRITTTHGTVSVVLANPWRKLKIKWDTQMPTDFEWMSPWQVNY